MVPSSFDFDGVLVHGDSDVGFPRERICRRGRRMTLTLLVAPIALPLFLTRRWLPRGARIYARIARLGDTREGYEAHLLDYSLRRVDGVKGAGRAGKRGLAGSLELVPAAMLFAETGSVRVLPMRGDQASPSRFTNRIDPSL